MTQRGPLARESLALGMLETSSQPERMAWLAQVVPGLEGSGVIYVLTIADTTRVASFLRTQGIDAHAYSGETEPERRLELEDSLIADEVKALVATSALGMGFDKPDLGFVIHYQSPGSAVAYYQRVGRAGRALPHAPVVLLRGTEDRDIQDYFSRWTLTVVAAALLEAGQRSRRAVRLREGRQRLTAYRGGSVDGRLIELRAASIEDVSALVARPGAMSTTSRSDRLGLGR